MTREDQSVSWFKGTRGLLTFFLFADSLVRANAAGDFS